MAEPSVAYPPAELSRTVTRAWGRPRRAPAIASEAEKPSGFRDQASACAELADHPRVG